MAIVAVTFDGTRIDAADAAGNWDDLDSVKAATVNNDFFYQGTGSIGFKVGNTKIAGMEYEAAAGVNYSSTKRVLLLKGLVTTPGILEAFGANGEGYRVGSDQSNYWLYWVRGGPTSVAGRPQYPAAESWLVEPIDPDVTGHRTVASGSPVITAIDYYAHQAQMTGTPIDQNFATDALDYVTSGKGLTLVGGDSTDPDGTFADFVLEDEGDVANRWGVARTISVTPAITLVVGMLTIGSATATVFTDRNGIVVFQGGRCRAGWCGLAVDLAHATSVVTLSAYTFLGAGRTATKRFFDTTLQVNGTTEVITVIGHGLVIGDAVTYSREGGVDDIGPEPGEFFVDVLTDDTFTLHATQDLAYAGTTPQDLTAAAAPGENHSVVLANDTRPDHELTNTSGSYAADACAYDSFRVITLVSVATVTGGFILRTKTIIISTGSLDGVAISDATLEEGEALIDPATTLANIDDCGVTAGVEGHLVRVTVAGTYAFVGNVLTGFWAPATNGWNFDTITGVDAGTEVITTDAAHGFTDGEAVFYNDEGLSDTVGLTDLAKYYVNGITATTLSLHATRAAAIADSSRINLSDGATGQTHSLYSGRAAIFNDSGGAVTINVSGGGSGPSVRNGGGASTTVSNPVIHTVSNLRTSDRVVWIRVSDDAELENKVEVAGVATFSYEFVAPFDVDVQVLSGDNTKKNTVTRVTLGATDSGFPAVQADDPTYSNP